MTKATHVSYLVYLSKHLPVNLSCLSIYLPIYIIIWLSIYLSIYLSTYLPIYLSIIYLSIYLSIHPSIHPSIHLSVVYRSIYLASYLSIHLSLSIFVSIYSISSSLSSLSIYLSIHLSLSIFVSIYLSIYLSRLFSLSTLSIYLLSVWWSLYLSMFPSIYLFYLSSPSSLSLYLLISLKYSNLNYLARTKRTGDSIVTHTYQKLRLGFCCLCEVGIIRPNLGLSPLRVTVTTRIIPVLVGDPNPNLQFVTGILGRGTTQSILVGIWVHHSSQMGLLAAPWQWNPAKLLMTTDGLGASKKEGNQFNVNSTKNTQKPIHLRSSK